MSFMPNEKKPKEGSTMSRFSNIFTQLLQFFPRLEFYKMVKETKAERHTRMFTCWGQFVVMLLCQLSGLGGSFRRNIQ